MNEQELKVRFPRASKSFIDANATISSSKPEQDIRPAVVYPAQGKEKSDDRIVVRIVMHRVRTLDPDNATGAVKPLVDCLRYVHLIPDDTSAHIDLQVSQERVAHYKDQKTELTITYA